MLVKEILSTHYPTHYPMNFSGKLTYKIILKKDYIRTDGTCSLYIQVFLQKSRKRLPCNISVRPIDFDENKQRIKKSCKMYKDYNLIIEQMLATINKIEVNFRLNNQVLTMERLIEEFTNPTSRLDFLAFWQIELEKQKDILQPGTYKHQLAALNKVRKFQDPILFNDITDDLLNKLKVWCKKSQGNLDATVQGTLKNFKKFLHLANKKGIGTPLHYTDIKLKNFEGNRTFLMPNEISKLYKYYDSEFINPTHRNVLARFLFSCFTGLRISDILKLTKDNFSDNAVFFSAQKTGKIQRIPLNKSALKFINQNTVFEGSYTEPYINRELKSIAKITGITKKITFHVSRHTFATNYLIANGRVEHLQKLLGHSNIRETMVYVHIVDSITNQQIHNMDEILKL